MNIIFSTLPQHFNEKSECFMSRCVTAESPSAHQKRYKNCGLFQHTTHSHNALQIFVTQTLSML
jgi:hypothetical protein